MTTTPIPTTVGVIIETEDYTGNRCVSRLNVGFSPRPESDSAAFWALTTNAALSLVYNPDVGSDIARNVAALTSAKIVRMGLIMDMDFAERPASETGAWPLVQTKAALHYLDNTGQQERFSLPAPVGSIFMTAAGQQNVVDPGPFAGGSGLIWNLSQAVAALGIPTRGGGTWGAQFSGGQLVQGKPPRRRRILGQ